MYKLPISKYKNAAPKLVKKDQSINGLSTNRLLNTIGNLINCNLNYVAFAFDTQSGGGSICVGTHEDLSKKQTFNNELFSTVHAHSGSISDIQFNPFSNNILATSAFDSQINLWSLNSGDYKVGINQINSLNLLNESRCDSIQWNPNVENIIISSSLSTLYLWDVEHGSIVNTIRAHNDSIQSTSWKRDGSLLVTSSKDKTIQIIDPRANDGFNRIENSKTNNKDSKVVWIGNSDYSILSSVYSMNHQRELHLWDVRNTSAPSFELTIDIGNNVLTPYLDSDTGMLFLIGKAESVIRYYEIFPDIPNIAFNSPQTLDDQIKSVCVLPKFGLDLMKCEINRLILLTRQSVYPMPYIIPRRSYYEFHADVFPDTFINEPNVSKQNWLNGDNGLVNKTRFNLESQKLYNSSLSGVTSAPDNKILNSNSNGVHQNGNSSVYQNSSTNASANSIDKKIEPIIVYEKVNQPLGSVNDNNNVNISSGSSVFSSVKNKINEANKLAIQVDIPKQQQETTPVTTPITPAAPVSFNILREKKPQNNTNLTTPQNRASKVKSVYYQSKFKYINGKVAHRNDHITNIRNLSTMWPGECNGFQINSKRAAFLLAGSGGQISVVELSKPGRLTDSVIYSIINKSKVSDFAWDPFDDERLAAACDECVVKIWQLPPEGLISSLEEPQIQLKGHLERLYCIKYHPYVRNLLASASYDRTIRLWNVESGLSIKILTGHTDVIFSISWSPCGSKLATICKDGFLRVYEPVVSESPVIQEKAGPPAGGKSARIEWVSNGNSLLISGFGKGNLRQLYLYGSEDINQLQIEDINQSPSLLIPYYDPDINVLFLYAKGEETIYLYEIQDSEPYFQVLTPYKPEGGIHFALAFLNKQYCDIRQVEIAKAYRLTKDNRIESISFTVPRVKQTLFQDDIFPDTIDRRNPYLEVIDWFESRPIKFNYICLQPTDMQKLTDVLAVEQEQNSSTKKENKRPEPSSSTFKRGMLDQNQFNEQQGQIISKMLQRATLYKEETSEEEAEADDWQ